MKLWTLIENTTCASSLRAEHGLSLYLETDHHHILFDAGQSGAFADNAEQLGIDLSQVDLVILSHGHYDHGGGLSRFLAINDKAPIYLSRYAFEAHHNATDAYIGLNPALQSSDRLVFVDGNMALGKGLTLCSCNERSRPYPADPFGLTVAEDGVLVPDDFRHEQYLLIEEAEKTILISGCSHKGILNIVDWFRPDVLIGGFHFMKLDPAGSGAAVLETAAQQMLQYPTCYYTGHCTGEAQFQFLKDRMGDRLQNLSTGCCLTL